MSDHVPDLKEKCLLSNDIYDYWYVSQGKTTVPSIDDKEDMMFADEAFDILGFTHDDKYDTYKNTACMMHMGIGEHDQRFCTSRERRTSRNQE